MEVNYQDYDIIIADIWQYEQSLFLSGKSSTELATKIIDKVEDIIIQEGTTAFGINYRDNKDEKIRTYYERNKREHAEASVNLKEKFEIDFFFNKYSCFQYDQHIIITRENIDFDFWFALKLRQYDSKISIIKEFLDFQLEKSFINDDEKYIYFLTLNIRQFDQMLYESRIVDTVNDWIINKSKAKEGNELQDLEDDKLILKINNYNRLELFDALKPYFDEKDHEKLNHLLNEEVIQDKICFRSNANQLIMLFRQLHLNQKIIGKLVDTEKWICKYFTYFGQKKKHSDFDADNVHKILTSSSYRLTKSKRIDLPRLDYIIDKSE